jgi:hypothetical protein
MKASIAANDATPIAIIPMSSIVEASGRELPSSITQTQMQASCHGREPHAPTTLLR